MDLMDKPIWRLAAEELDALPEPQQRWAREHLARITKSGVIDLLIANDPRTIYETIWDSDAGKWKLQPSSLSPDPTIPF